MPRRQKQMTCLSSGLVALAALATGGMSSAAPDRPLQMSNLRITSGGIAGYEVVDVEGARVGEIVQVNTDDRGRARWLRVALDDGGEVTLASFRAMLDSRHETVQLKLPYDLVVRRAEPETLSSLSA
ncbi:MAG: hypothetical protein Q8R02_21865 [Hyphomonadaceae bacterium]|nr:hypothetical protein [Hyphomonadaceae bacterium]